MIHQCGLYPVASDIKKERSSLMDTNEPCQANSFKLKQLSGNIQDVVVSRTTWLHSGKGYKWLNMWLGKGINFSVNLITGFRSSKPRQFLRPPTLSHKFLLIKNELIVWIVRDKGGQTNIGN